MILGMVMSSNYFNPNDTSGEPKKSTAQGTRGCPYKLGDLFLIESTEEDKKIYLNVNINRPVVVYQVQSEQDETLLITLTEIRGKLERQLIYEKTIPVKKNGFIVLTLPNLKSSTSNYLLSAVLLCQNQPYYGKTINALLNLVPHPTEIERFLERRKLSLNYEH